MKRYTLFLVFSMLFFLGASAQSSMTDEQVMKFVVKEHANGTSQAQIVTKLIQNGVDIGQIRRVKNKYERLQKGSGLGTATGKADTKAGSRLRQPSADVAEEAEQGTSFQVKDRRASIRERESVYDESNPEWQEMQDALFEMAPDTAQMFKRLKAEKQRKRVFGRDIFNNKKLSFEPNMNIATPQNYKLGPGDAVFIDIYGASQKTIEGTVSPEGTVTIEGFGPVYVSGMTVSQANAQLRSQLGARYQSSKVKLSVGQTRSIMVNVMGEVKTPGTYTLSAFATVFHALYMAGGISDIGTLRNIKVYRNNRLVSVVDIYDYILNGKLSGNVRLADNDVIAVGAYDCLVNITGKVKRPMYYEMRKNESVASVLKYAGGFTGDAYKKSLRLVRKTGREYSVYSVNEFDMPSFHVNDGDSLSVDSILPRFSNMVEVKGAVFRPGMYQVGGEINSVRTLIESAEGLKEEAFTKHAVMHRMREDRTLEVISVDVDGIMQGKVADVPLRNEDVLFIPTKQEMMEEQTITIHGEVNYPGVYKYAANETLEDFVLQAGGLKQTASTVKVDVAHRIVNAKAEKTDSLIAKTYSFALKDGFVIDGESGFHLMPFDEVYVRRSPGYSRQQNITVEGEVMFSGTYTLSKRQTRLSDVLQAAGGVTDRAYLGGARLERWINSDERKRMEEVRNKEIEKMKQEKMELAARKNLNIDMKDLSTVEKFDIGNTYYVGINLDKALLRPGSDEDVVLREGDRIIVPEYTNTIKVNGEVMYPTSMVYTKGKSAKYYIDQAGGFTSNAKKSQVYILYMNGVVAKLGHDAKPKPGCEIIVPQKSINRMSTAETLSIGTSLASVATMFATIANILK